MKPESYRQVLDGALRKRVPDDINLLPQIATRFVKGQSVMKRRTQISLGIFLALIAVAIALFSAPGVVAAMQRLLGYVPNVGIVDQSVAPVRKLAQPVSQTRDGLTVSVGSATLTSESTLMHIKMAGIPASAYPDPPSDSQPFTDAMCDDFLYLRLPDGTRNDMDGWMPAFSLGDPQMESDWTFTPIPGNIDSATLVIPCLLNTKTGTIPENWELPLQFVPVDPEDILQVIIPAADTGAPAYAQAPAVLGGVATLDSIVRMPDGDVFYGTLKWPDSSRFEFTSGVIAFHMTDANGRLIPTELGPEGTSSIQDGDPFVPFSIKTIVPIQVPGPVTLSIDQVKVYPVEQPDKNFILDTGPSPQVGQQWSVDQEIQAAEYSLRLVSVTLLVDGYRLVFQAASRGEMALSPYIFVDNGKPYPTGECLPQGETLDCTLEYPDRPTGGVVTIGYWLSITLTGPWQVTWTP